MPGRLRRGLLLRGNRIDLRSIDATRCGHTPMLDRFRRRAGPAQTRAGTAKDPSTVTGRGLGPSGRLCGRRQSAPASLRGARPARAHTLRAVLVTPADAAGEPCAGCANRRIFRALTKVLGPRGSKWPPGRVGAGARKQAEASPGSFGAALHFLSSASMSICRPARGERRRFYYHGLRRGSRRCRQGGAWRDDQTDH